MGRKFASVEERRSRKNARITYANNRSKAIEEKRNEAIRKMNKYMTHWDVEKYYGKIDFDEMSDKEIFVLEREMAKKSLEAKEKYEREEKERWDARLKKQRERDAKRKAEKEKAEKARAEELERQRRIEAEARAKREAEARYQAALSRVVRENSNYRQKTVARKHPDGTYGYYENNEAGMFDWLEECERERQWLNKKR